MKRAAGILMHISSLPGKYGIGTLGKNAYEFANFLKKSGQTLWQILPIGPTSFGDSPYQSFSVHAGNPYFIDLEMLCEDGLLSKNDCNHFNFGDSPINVDYKKIYDNRFKLLKKAFMSFKDSRDTQFNKFKLENRAWLFDYSLFMAVKSHYNMAPWHNWPDENIKTRTADSVEYYSELLKNEIEFFMFLQYLFYSQWAKLKKYVNSLGIKIIGDMPIYVGLDSADTWSYPEVFWLDCNKKPVKVSGCPPDGFSPKGQLWGNPLYNWKYLKSTNYSWWINRIKTANKLFDITRIDHFRGFDSYYAIPFGANDATCGEWLNGPGIDFFNMLKEKLGDIPIIAEDLGFLTASVKKLLSDTGYPGMKVLQFAFESQKENDYLPHNYVKNCIAYTGTHDNDTIMGWFKNGRKQDILHAVEYGALNETEGYSWGLIRLCYASVSKAAIIPMQDFLGLDSRSRMNIPSTVGGNWTWRVLKEQITDDLADKIKHLTKLYGRI